MSQSQFEILLKQLRAAATDAMFARARSYPDAKPGSVATERAERQGDRVRRVQRWAVPHPVPVVDGLILSRRRPPRSNARLLTFTIPAGESPAHIKRGWTYLPSIVLRALQECGAVRLA